MKGGNITMRKNIFSIWSHFVMTLFGLTVGWITCDYMHNKALNEAVDRRRKRTDYGYSSYKETLKEEEP